MDTIKIIVYSGISLGGCGCGSASCTPADTKTEYENVKRELLEKYGEQQINIELIDTGGVKLSDYPEVEKVIRAGYSFPITVINGSPYLAGAISADSIIDVISELQKPDVI